MLSERGIQMKVGIIGLGNIAQKAYLPIYASLRNDIEFILSTRNEKIRKEISKRYGFEKTTTSVDQLIQTGIKACFVHVATNAHGSVVKQLLEAGIHVCVDKPLSEEFAEVLALKKLAAQKNCLLMVSFNRRFAPLVEELKKIETKNMIIIQKNRVATQASVSFVIYDLFLHVVDTLVYLLDDPIEHVDTKIIEEAGELKRAVLQVETSRTTAIAIMDLFAGANTEMYQVLGPTGTMSVENLTKFTMQTPQQTVEKAFDDWTPTLTKRGFQQVVTTFIEAVKTNNSEKIRQEKVVCSHELCAQMIRTHQQQIL